MHEILQLPQGWQSLGRLDSTVQISRDFELFSASFKDHPVIPLYILQIQIKIFLLQFFKSRAKINPYILLQAGAKGLFISVMQWQTMNLEH